MIQFPPIPSWDGLHPLIIHFPIALLLVAPLFVILGAVLEPRRGRPFLIAALVLMVLGTIGTLAAVSTGEAAGELAERAGQVEAVLERHEELAETTRTVFLALTAVFAAVLFVPRLFRRELARGPLTALLAVFLVSYGAGAVLLANTAHNGGRLVHELGVQAMIGSPGQPVAAAQAGGNAGEGGEAGEQDAD